MGKEFNSSRGGNQRGGGKPTAGGRPRPPFKGGAGFKKKVTLVEPFKNFAGVYISRGDSDQILTLSLVPGESVYGEKRTTVEVGTDKVEYRAWNPYRSKIGAVLQGGSDLLGFGPGSKVLYLGGASGTTISHVADIVGMGGIVYGVEFSQRCGRDLINMAKKRTNVVPIIDDARKPQNYRFLVNMVDFVFADVAQPDQARIIALNCKHYLKNGGIFMIAIKASCIDSTVEPQVVFNGEIQKLKEYGLTPKKMMTLEPYQKDHAVVIGYYRP